MNVSAREKFALIGTAVTAVILALVPFHAFLTVWASSLVGHYTLLRLWKEILIVLVFPVAVYLMYRRRELWLEVKRSWLMRLMLLYFCLVVVAGVVAYGLHRVSPKALGYGLIVDLRFIGFFFEAWVFASCVPWLRSHVRNLFIIPAALVVIFGLLQAFVLPAGFLAHFGYSALTIPPYQTVNHDMQYVRVQSFLRGSDPLGAYLVFVISLLSSLLLIRRIRGRMRYAMVAGILASLVVLFFSYSRSAYIGTVLALMLIAWSTIKSRKVRYLFVSALVAVVCIGGASYLVLKDNARFENTFLHTSQGSKSPRSSDQNHVSAASQGLHDVLHEPLGHGTGTAGPASVYNTRAPARIPEDYYLQLGEEVGWLGLGLFVAIVVLTARRLWCLRKDWFALALLASLLGISFIGLLTQVWTDDTLSLVWWGAAGVMLAVPPKPEKTTGKRTVSKDISR